MVYLLRQEYFDVLVIRDDSIMDDDETALIVGPLGMSVPLAGNTVSCPTGVRYAHMAVSDAIEVKFVFHCKGQFGILAWVHKRIARATFSTPASQKMVKKCFFALVG